MRFDCSFFLFVQENKDWHLFELSAGNTIHIKYQALFSLKKNNNKQ